MVHFYTHYLSIGGSGFGIPFWVRGYKNTLPRRAPPPRMHGKTRAGVVCFSLERKTHFVTPFHLLTKTLFWTQVRILDDHQYFLWLLLNILLQAPKVLNPLVQLIILMVDALPANTKIKGCNSVTVHIWPYVGKVKMRLPFFSIFKNLFTSCNSENSNFLLK